AATAPTGAPVCVPFPGPHSSFTARRTRLRLPFRRSRWRCCLERNASWCLSRVTCRLGRRQTCSSLSWTPSLPPHLWAPFATLYEACKASVIYRSVSRRRCRRVRRCQEDALARGRRRARIGGVAGAERRGQRWSRALPSRARGSRRARPRGGAPPLETRRAGHLPRRNPPTARSLPRPLTRTRRAPPGGLDPAERRDRRLDARIRSEEHTS